MFRKSKTLSLNKVADIPVADSGYSLVSQSISNCGQALFLFVENEFNADGPIATMDQFRRFKLIVQSHDEQRAIDLGEHSFAFPVFDIFPDGRIVMASSRCEWRENNDFDLNGKIFDPDGHETITFLAGDGIEALSVDDQSRIFISYFDEGVFGNLGWGSDPGPTGPGAGGLNCFNDQGECIWQFNNIDGEGKFISDCYAMNITGSQTYIYYYSDFELCRIDGNFDRKFWTTRIEGCHHFAINEDGILFSGAYGEAVSRFHWAKLLDGRLSKFEKVTVKLENGELSKNGTTIARRDKVNYFNDQDWFQASIDELSG